MNTHKKDVTSLKTEKDTLQEMLQLKAREVKSTLVQELNKVEDEMKRHCGRTAHLPFGSLLDRTSFGGWLARCL
mgnify:CR=1 FL=1